jgi:hypothetical protein
MKYYNWRGSCYDSMRLSNMKSIFILWYGCACWHFLLKQACLTEVKTWHAKWSFSSLLFQTLCITTSHMISRCWFYSFHTVQTHHILKISKPPFTCNEAALLLTNRLCSGCITAQQSTSPQHHWLRTLSVPPLPTILTRPSLPFQRKVSW